MEEKNNNCPVCNKDLDEDVNFCPVCGEPITDYAKDLVKQNEINAQLSILQYLVKFIDDEKNLKLIKAMIYKLTNNSK